MLCREMCKINLANGLYEGVVKYETIDLMGQEGPYQQRHLFLAKKF